MDGVYPLRGSTPPTELGQLFELPTMPTRPQTRDFSLSKIQKENDRRLQAITAIR